MKLLILCALLANPLSAHAAKFFYSLPQTGTDSGEWVYQVSSCKVLPEKKYAAIQKGCSAEKEHEVCSTKEKASAKSATSGKARKFPQVLVVFKSKSECAKGRADYLRNPQ